MALTRLFSSHRNRQLVLLAGLVFVLSQSINLQHTHNGDLNLQTDCHICFKLGSSGNATLVAALPFSADPQSQSYLAVKPEPVYLASQPARSRSPPLLFV